MYTTLHLGLSYACNMRCEHCFVNRKNDRLSFEKITEIIDKLYDQGLLIIYYTYGEPLLAKRFFDVTEYAAKKGLVQILMTNGSILTDDYALRIKEAGISNVYVSIDSAQSEKHDGNRRFKGAYAAALNGIRILKRHGIHVGISSTVTGKNVRELHDIYDLALEEDVRIISFLRARDGQAVEMFDEEDMKEYINFFKFGIAQNKAALKFHDPQLLPYLEKWYDAGEITELEYEKYSHMNSCHKNTTISVAPDGTVSHCNLIGDAFGNVLDGGF